MGCRTSPKQAVPRASALAGLELEPDALYPVMNTTFRKALESTLVTLLIGVGIVVVLPLMFAGGPLFFRREGRTEVLHDPRSVSAVASNGLIMADGSVVKIPYVVEVPTNLPVLQEALKRGVEIDQQGHVVGLIRAWHWCRNDPIRSHVGRVDISGFLLVAGVLS